MNRPFMTMTARDRAVSAAEFKLKCLALFDEVESRGRTFVITKRGRPVARVIPLAPSSASPLRGSLTYEEELLTAIDVEWDAVR